MGTPSLTGAYETGTYDTMAALSQAQSKATVGEQDKAVAALRQGKTKTPEQIDAAAEDFEAFFLSQMLKPMFDTVKTDPVFGGGHGEDMWKSLMVNEYAKKIAQNGGVGIADQVKAVMLQAQESQT